MAQLSIIIATPDNYHTISRTINYLRKQSVRNKLELVIVSPSEHNLELDKAILLDFESVVVISVGPIESISLARSYGVNSATSPIFVFIEDHCFPEPGWAEALICAHRQNWAVVGPVVSNANPNTISWANFAIEYIEWLHPARSGQVSHLPGHNSSYKRDILDRYRCQLDAWLESESILHWDLKRKGYQLYLEPSAKIRHLNFSKLSASISLRLIHGRLFAGSRSKKWTNIHKFLYIIGGPLIPFVRLYRILKQLRRHKKRVNFILSLLPALILLLVFDALGEIIGYTFGRGNAPRQITRFEFHRERFLNPADRKRLEKEWF